MYYVCSRAGDEVNILQEARKSLHKTLQNYASDGSTDSATVEAQQSDITQFCEAVSKLTYCCATAVADHEPEAPVSASDCPRHALLPE